MQYNEHIQIKYSSQNINKDEGIHLRVANPVEASLRTIKKEPINQVNL